MGKLRSYLLSAFSLIIFSNSTFGQNKISGVIKTITKIFWRVLPWEKPSGLPHIKQEFGAKTLLDASISFNITKQIQLTAGGNYITNVYPDKVLPTLSAYSTGQTPYNRYINQFGFSGAFYYGIVTVKF